MVALRHDLVAALAACAHCSSRAEARSFLSGLSSDELQFIADFQAACILESHCCCRSTREQLAARVAEFQRSRGATCDQDHKMILLLEYLCRSGMLEERGWRAPLFRFWRKATVPIATAIALPFRLRMRFPAGKAGDLA
jgi:hypothetical protein